MTTAAHLVRGALATGAGLLALASVATAQAPASDVRWETWIGCWQPTAAPDAVEPAGVAPVTCIVPAGDAAVEVVTVVEGAVAHRETVRAGERRSIEREGCSGWETVTGSEDGRRVFRSSEFACEGNLQRRATGIMAMAEGQWLDVTGVSAGGYTDVQVVRYRPTDVPEVLDAASRTALEGRTLAVEAARLAAAAPVSLEGVVEATRQLEPEVVEAWLVERGQGFAVDAPRLVQLADAGVPERVIDLMVALSYPDVFAVNADSREGRMRPGSNQGSGRTVRPRPVYGMGYPGGYYGLGGYYPGYGYGGYYGGHYGGYPVVIVEKEPEDAPRGRAVKGRGYTRGGSGSGAVSPSDRPSGSRSGGSGSDASSSGGSSDSSGSSSSGRKAKPRGGG